MNKKEGKELSDNLILSNHIERWTFKNQHVATMILVADLGRSHQWILRLVRYDEEQDIGIVLGLSPQKTLLNYKWENDDFTEIGRAHV